MRDVILRRLKKYSEPQKRGYVLYYHDNSLKMRLSNIGLCTKHCVINVKTCTEPVPKFFGKRSICDDRDMN